MKLKTLLAAALCAVSLLFAACTEPQPHYQDGTGKDFSAVNMESAQIPVGELASHLLKTVQFDDPNMAEMDGEIAGMLYNVSDLAQEIASYGSTGATAEAVLVLRCGDTEKAAAAAERVGQYRTEMAEIYLSYNEPESRKLTNALLARDGVYVVYVVAPDSAAAEAVYHDFAVQTVFGTSEESK